MLFRFESLEIWQTSVTFATKIYPLTKKLPREEMFALADQLRRSACSISTNIAEGSGSSSKKDFGHYLDIAIKSLYEVVSLLLLAEKLEYISKNSRQELYGEADTLVRKIRAFQKSLDK